MRCGFLCIAALVSFASSTRYMLKQAMHGTRSVRSHPLVSASRSYACSPQCLFAFPLTSTIQDVFFNTSLPMFLYAGAWETKVERYQIHAAFTAHGSYVNARGPRGEGEGFPFGLYIIVMHLCRRFACCACARACRAKLMHVYTPLFYARACVQKVCMCCFLKLFRDLVFSFRNHDCCSG